MERAITLSEEIADALYQAITDKLSDTYGVCWWILPEDAIEDVQDALNRYATAVAEQVEEPQE